MEKLNYQSQEASLLSGNNGWSDFPAFAGEHGEEAAQEKSQSWAERAVQEAEEHFTKIMTNNHAVLEKTRQSLEKLERKKEAETDEWRAERYAQQIRDRQRVLRMQEALVEFARVPTVEDVEYRAQVKQEFAQLVREAVPDELPLVFHGTNNLGNVRQIIRTHGLLTPEQRGESMTSFANLVDVTAKNNIQTSCDFAESGSYWMPYGAIFAFMPKPEELGIVRETEANRNSEVSGGVDGVDFKVQPERLYGIITTPENISRIREWCEEEGLDANKVVTHGDFLARMMDFD